MICILQFLNSNSDTFSSLSSIVVACLAIYGVREWKRQTIGKTDYDIARRYLKAALRLRDALKFVRNPFISADEMEEALKEHGLDGDIFKDRDRTNRAVYSVRWKSVQEAWSALELERLDAEVSWGYEASRASCSLIAATRDLLVALNVHLGGRREKHTKEELIYNDGTENNPDEYSLKIDAAINEIRDFLKPHLS